MQEGEHRTQHSMRCGLESLVRLLRTARKYQYFPVAASLLEAFVCCFASHVDESWFEFSPVSLVFNILRNHVQIVLLLLVWH